ncbi:MAG: hypothetical protein PHW62_00165 [Candidatus Ratteibacteria bacterium]|nr:hypothetical protein [Candidatus Ratteibacteria bacterium]
MKPDSAKKLVNKLKNKHHTRSHKKCCRQPHDTIDWRIETHNPNDDKAFMLASNPVPLKLDDVDDEWLRNYKERNKILSRAFYPPKT